MPHPLSTLLLAVTALTAQAGLAHAEVMTGSHATFDPRGYTPVSVVGDTFTVSSATYSQNGSPFPFLDRASMQFIAQEGYYLTGKFHVVMDISYSMPDQIFNRALDISAGYDALYPPCEQCGPFDSALVGYGNGYASGRESEGVLHLDYGNDTAVTGTYERLFFASFLYASFNELYGQFRVDSYAITVQTMPLASAVPELPPAAMLGAGLAVLALYARRRQRS